MGKKVLITGGAGFVGSHTADALIRKGHAVRIFDNLTEQVHAAGVPPAYIPTEAEFVRGDMRDLEALGKVVRGVDVIFHLAAAVGVGQSMFEIAYYTAVNNQGSANLLQAILDTRTRVEKIVVASSMSIYGEGQYFCSECGRSTRFQKKIRKKCCCFLAARTGSRSLHCATSIFTGPDNRSPIPTPA